MIKIGLIGKNLRNSFSKKLFDKKFNKENINEAKNIIVQEFNPIDDMRASKEYRSKISQNLLERFLLEKDNINTLVY